MVFTKLHFNPPASEASRVVANFIERNYPHTPVYGVKEFVCLSVYLDNLAYVQVVINCRYSIAQMCTQEDTHARLFRRSVFDDVMSQNELTTTHC